MGRLIKYYAQTSDVMHLPFSAVSVKPSYKQRPTNAWATPLQQA